MFKVNNKDTKTTSLVSLVVTLKIFHTFFYCFHWWLWTGKCPLGYYPQSFANYRPINDHKQCLKEKKHKKQTWNVFKTLEKNYNFT